MKILILFFTVCMLFISCKSVKSGHSYPFTVTEASYYSWFVSETERGIEITISLNNVREGVIFDSLVFRAMKMPVTFVTKDDNVLVKAVLPGNESVLENRAVPDSSMNGLIYTWRGQRSFCDIGKLTRQDSKYLKRE